MANSLEFSPSGHPIENRYDGYGEFLADSLLSGEEGRYGDNRNDPFWYDGWTITELEAEMRAKGIPLPEQGDMEDTDYEETMRGILRETGAVDDYDPFAPVETDEERQERGWAELEAWGEAYGCLDDDQDDEEDAGE